MKTRFVARLELLILILAGLHVPRLWSATTISIGSDPTKHVLKGKIFAADQVLDGEVVIENETITCVAADCNDPPGATIFRITNAYIFPGFVDAHNHV